MSLMPGITLRTGDFLLNTKADIIPLNSLSSNNDTGPNCISVHTTLGNWLQAGIRTRLDMEKAVYTGSDGITVLFDGYLSDINGIGTSSLSLDKPAQTIATLYRKHGTGFLLALRGSFVGLIIDQQSNTAKLFNDRRGSRPLFYRRGKNGSILFNPEVLTLSDEYPALTELNWLAVCEFLTSATFYSDHTLYRDVFKFPQAGLLVLHNGGIDMKQYWQIKFAPPDNTRSEDDLVEEYDVLIRQATKRLLKITEKPFLFLSGGVDSRVVLGCLMSEGMEKIPIAVYGSTEGGGDDDLAIAQTMAKQLNLPLSVFQFPISEFKDLAHDSTFFADCRAETIDAGSLILFYKQLGTKFCTFFNGDHCFGMKMKVSSFDEALTVLEHYKLSQVSRLEDWLHPDKRKNIKRGIDKTFRSLIQKSQETEPNNLKDNLYYQGRFGNKLNAFTAGRLRYMEQARPLTDEDVVEFILRIPIEMRIDKILLRKVLEKKYPSLLNISVAKKDSLPSAETFKILLAHHKHTTEYLHNQLINNLDYRLSQLINISRIEDFLICLLDKKPFPRVQTQWWMRVPGMWRFIENKVHPVRILLRLLQLNIYLTSRA